MQIGPYTINDRDTVAVLEHFLEPPGSSILEVGAHDEPLANILTDRGFTVTGIDLRPYDQFLPACNHRHIQGDLCDWSMLYREGIKPASFDCVIAISCIEHFGLGTYSEGKDSIYADAIAMHTIRQLLRLGGTCYLTVPYGKHYYICSPHWRMYNRWAVLQSLSVGFDVEVATAFIADNVTINGVARKPGDDLTAEEADNYIGLKPHISILLKMRKASSREKESHPPQCPCPA